jgi:hypothetical protein
VIPPAKPEESVPNRAEAGISSNEEASSLMITVSSQLESVRDNGKCTVKLIESLVDMVSNLTKEVAHLKNDNVLLQQEIKICIALLRPPLGSLLRAFLMSNAFRLRRCPNVWP